VPTEIESLPYKKEDRKDYNAAFGMRGNCDDVLLLKNGLLTDTSICNIAFFDGRCWLTPAKPLIYGVNRASLLEEGKIIEKDIKLDELKKFSNVRLFNAMIEFGEIELKIRDIHI
jgi:4-amino-4-deoxychorismate lyase